MAFLENNVMIERISALKKERGAVILAHNYELADVWRQGFRRQS